MHGCPLGDPVSVGPRADDEGPELCGPSLLRLLSGATLVSGHRRAPAGLLALSPALPGTDGARADLGLGGHLRQKGTGRAPAGGDAMTLAGPDLRSRFGRAAVAAGATRPSEAVVDELLIRYAEPHRHYHTLEHVVACLKWLDRFREVAEHPEEVELALWYHDAIYVPGAGDNESRSAE